MKETIFVVITLLGLFTTCYSRLIAPSEAVFLDKQRMRFLIDINSADSFVIQRDLIDINKTGYNPKDSAYYEDLHQKFSTYYNSNLAIAESSVSGSIGQDFVQYPQPMKNPYNVTFAVVSSVRGHPTVPFYESAPYDGRIGYNPFAKASTDLGDKIYRKPRLIFSMMAGCNDLCWGIYGFGGCIKQKTENKTIKATVTTYPNSWWQIEATGYKFEKVVSSRKFNVIFSTTSPDIGVPLPVFTQINREFKAVKEDSGRYKVDCKERFSGKNISVIINGEDVILRAFVFVDVEDKDTCFLRIKPLQTNYWVFGLNFYMQYASCFQPELKEVHLNRLPEKMFPSALLNQMVNSDKTFNGVRVVTEIY